MYLLPLCIPQTNYHFQGLDTKLKAIEDKFADQFYLEEHSLGGRHKTGEERIIAFQKEASTQAKQEVEEEISRFRQTELARVRMEERANSRREVELMREQFEREYRAKLETAQKKEEERMEMNAKKERALEEARYTQRQLLLEEMERLQVASITTYCHKKNYCTALSHTTQSSPLVHLYHTFTHPFDNANL